jgi:hypothetical protein
MRYNQIHRRAGQFMGKGDPLHQRSTLGYLLVSLLVAFIGSVVFTPLGGWIQRAIGPTHSMESSREPASPTISPNVSHLDSAADKPKADPKRTAQGAAERTVSENEKLESRPADKREDLKKRSLAQQSDSFAARFYSVEASLRQRAQDLGGLPIKPEITAAIETTRSDLTEAKEALAHGDLEGASLRMNRVEEALKYLESL